MKVPLSRKKKSAYSKFLTEKIQAEAYDTRLNQKSKRILETRNSSQISFGPVSQREMKVKPRTARKMVGNVPEIVYRLKDAKKYRKLIPYQKKRNEKIKQR